MLRIVLQIFLLMFCLSITNSFSQSNQNKNIPKLIGAIVSYEDGTLIPNAKIIVEGNNFRREMMSNSDGEYELELPKGIYKVTVEKAGFRKFTRTKVKIGDYSFLLNINLEFGKLIIVDEKHP